MYRAFFRSRFLSFASVAFVAKLRFTRANVNRDPERENEDVIGVTATCDLSGNIGRKGARVFFFSLELPRASFDLQFCEKQVDPVLRDLIVRQCFTIFQTLSSRKLVDWHVITKLEKHASIWPTN